MSIRDLFERLPKAQKFVTPAQAHVKACLAGGREIIRKGDMPEGWEPLGAGYFSQVAAVDDCTVVKTGDSLDGGYVYAMWCLANQDLEAVPRIYAVQRVQYFEQEYDDMAGAYVRGKTQAEGYIVVMERLQELPKDNWGGLKEGCLKAQFDTIGAAQYKDNYYECGKHERTPCGDAMVRLRNYINAAIRANGHSIDHQYFDMHYGNAMVRGDVLVITDPLATVQGKTKGKFARKRYTALRAQC